VIEPTQWNEAGVSFLVIARSKATKQSSPYTKAQVSWLAIAGLVPAILINDA
jgi:hypothetical protein